MLTLCGSSNLLSSVNYTYGETTYPPQVTSNTPNHISINGSRGNVATITNYSGPTGITKHFDYFDTGNVYQSYDLNGTITTYNYANATSTCGNSFPTSTSVPVNSLSISTVWNCTGAVATKLTDANGQSTNITYANDTYFGAQIHRKIRP